MASPGTLYLEVDAVFDTDNAVLFCRLNHVDDSGLQPATTLDSLEPGNRYTVAGIDET